MIFIVVGAGAMVAGVVVWFIGKSKAQLKSDMEGTQTSSVNALLPGRGIELKGVANTETPLDGPGKLGDCLYYKYKVERRERRRDSEGRTRTQWRTIDSGESSTAFMLDDGTGQILVDPTGAEIDAPKVHTESGTEQGFSFSIGGFDLGALSGAPTRLTVWAIKPKMSLYILGDAVHGAGDSVEVRKGDGRFFISTKSEAELTKSLGSLTFVLNILAPALFFAGLWALVHGLMNR